MEKEIKITSKLYQYRDSMKKLLKEEFFERIKVYQNIIKSHMKRFNLSILASVLEICSLKSIRDDKMMTIMFMASAVELIEPSN